MSPLVVRLAYLNLPPVLTLLTDERHDNHAGSVSIRRHCSRDTVARSAPGAQPLDRLCRHISESGKFWTMHATSAKRDLQGRA